MERQQVRMYAVQAAAYEARQEYEPYVTKVPSTPETPPVVESDLTKACEAKKLALVNKPQVCSHCEAPLQTEYFEEFNGTIFAYCKSKGGCGKSQVLFVNPSRTAPVFAKCCIFEPSDPNDVFDRQTLLERTRGESRVAKRSDQLPYAAYKGDYIPISAACLKCDLPFKKHKQNIDNNGWAQVSTITLQVPEDWPHNLGGGAWSNI